MNNRRNFLAPMALAWVLVVAACSSSGRSPLAGGDPQACMATCERLAADCRADPCSAPVCKGAASPISATTSMAMRGAPASVAGWTARSLRRRTAKPGARPAYNPAVCDRGTAMSAILYHSPSTAALVVHWLLIELDLPHELRALDFDKREQKSPTYLALNPAGVVPTLVLDGQVLTEAAAIVMHPGRPPPRRRPGAGAGQRRACRVLPLDVLVCQHVAAGLSRLVLSRRAGRCRPGAGGAYAGTRGDRRRLGPTQRAPAGTRAVPARRARERGRFHADDVDALVAQHAASGGRLAAAGATTRGG